MDKVLGKITLRDAQYDALTKLNSGSILAGGVGSGKTYISIFWAHFKSLGKHIYVITEAVKRDKVEEGHTKPDWQESFDNCGISEESYTVDSWNNIKKYEHVTNALFLFDEQRAISYNPYSKTSWGTIFTVIAKNNDWILASATPGDEWIKLLPVFIGNGFYKNKTEFVKEHVVYDQYAKFPLIRKYINTARLERLRASILVPVNIDRHTSRHRIYIETKYDNDAFDHLMKTRFNEELQEPYDTASDFIRALRFITNSGADRVNKAFELIHQHKRIIIFYRFNYERDLLLKIAEDSGKTYSEWTGHKHQPIPETDEWVYICQYAAADKSWSCISTDAMLFYSITGSYATMEQCEGRIDRLNTPFKRLFYYYMVTDSKLDKRTMKALKSGKDFNENAWGRRQLKESNG